MACGGEDLSELERRLLVASHHAMVPMFASRVMNEAAGAIAECRRALETAESWYRSLEMLEEWGSRDGCRAPDVMRAVRAALSRLEGVADGTDGSSG